MEHRRLVLGELDTGIQHRPPAAARRVAHRLRVDVPVGRQHADLHAAPGCIDQRADRQVVGHEVGVRQVDALARRRDGQQVHQLHALAATAGRAAEHLRVVRAGRRQRREVALAMQHAARRAHPVVQKHRLHLRHHRALHAVVRVAPFRLVARVATPFVCNAHAAGEAQAPVHHQQLAVGAVVHLPPVAKARLVKAHALHAGRLHLVHQRRVHLQAAHPVQQHMHLHAGAGALGECVDELAADAPRPVDVGLKGDRRLGRADGRQHGREDLVAVEQRLHLVARHDLRAQQRAQRTAELRVIGLVQLGQLMLDLLFLAGQVLIDEHAQHRQRESGQHGHQI